MSIERRRVMCCHCPMACGVVAEVEDNRVVRITGDPEHAVSRGFICIKGERAAEYHDHPDRLDRPLKRTGARGEGRWTEIGWAQAIDEIAERLAAIRDRDGAQAVALASGTFHGADGGLGIRFMNLFGSPNTAGMGVPCAGPALEAESLTYGFGPTYVSPPVPGETRAIVVWGSRPSASQPPVWPLIRACQQAGAKLIVVDPIRTAEAEAADHWLPLRPGTDGALALAWLHVIIGEGLHDRDFVARWGHGFDALAERVRAWTPERAADITGVPAQAIAAAARDYATHTPGIINWGVANAQIGRNAVQTERAKACLRAITGGLDRPGGTLLIGPPRQARINPDIEAYDRLPPEQRRLKIGADRFRLHGEGYERLSAAQQRVWGRARVLSQVWGADVPSPLLWRAILDEEPYPVRALLVQHHNPLGAAPNARRVHDALVSPNLELSVVHELYMTPTAELADYVLPACHWLEKSALSTAYGWANMALTGERAVEPVAERHNDYELWRDLGHRLGQAEHWPATLEAFWDLMLEPTGVTFDELVRSNTPWILEPPVPAKHEQPDPDSGEPRGFGTPTGKVEFHSTIMAALGYDPLPDYEEPPESTVDDPQARAEWPLALITGGTLIESHHEGMRQTRYFRERYPQPRAQIHPDTAAAHGIADGQWVRIETPRGAIRQQAELTDRIRPDVVQADRWWYPEQPGPEPQLHGLWIANANVLTNDDPEACDPAYGTWALRANRCRIAPAEPPAAVGSR